MTEYLRDRVSGSHDTDPAERMIQTTRIGDTGGSATSFIVGGLVLAVALIAFVLIGDNGSQQSALVNMPPEMDNAIEEAAEPDAAPAQKPAEDGVSTAPAGTAGNPAN